MQIGYGCGGSTTDNHVPDRPLGNDFLPACRGHDTCYGDKAGPSKSVCDSKFRDDMLAVCAKKDGFGKAVCDTAAKGFYKAVDKYGGDAFNKARSK